MRILISAISATLLSAAFSISAFAQVDMYFGKLNSAKGQSGGVAAAAPEKASAKNQLDGMSGSDDAMVAAALKRAEDKKRPRGYSKPAMSPVVEMLHRPKARQQAGGIPEPTMSPVAPTPPPAQAQSPGKERSALAQGNDPQAQQQKPVSDPDEAIRANAQSEHDALMNRYTRENRLSRPESEARIEKERQDGIKRLQDDWSSHGFPLTADQAKQMFDDPETYDDDPDAGSYKQEDFTPRGGHGGHGGHGGQGGQGNQGGFQPSDPTINVRGDGSLTLKSTHSGETVSVRRNGNKFDDAALQKVTHLMRCRLTGQEMPIPEKLVELLSAIDAHFQHRGIYITSGYRSPRLNSSLKGAAKFSLHMKGWAADINIPGASPSSVRAYAATLGAGGVGAYPSFTHVDIGRGRQWGSN